MFLDDVAYTINQSTQKHINYGYKQNHCYTSDNIYRRVVVPVFNCALEKSSNNNKYFPRKLFTWLDICRLGSGTYLVTQIKWITKK